MVETDKKEFAILMGVLGEHFRNQPSKVQMRTYFEALIDLPIRKVDYGFRETMKYCDSFPSSKSIREYALTMPTKQVEPKQIAYTLPAEKRAKLAAQCGQYLDAVLAGGVPREMQLEFFLVMEGSYPGIGFREERQKLIKHFNMRDKFVT